MAIWTRPENSRKEVDRSGDILVDDNADPFSYEHALNVVNNWRSSHAYPLNTFQMTLRRRVRLLDNSGTTAQRIKRLPSIESKLRRESNMALSQMQDIGGCRGILSNITKARALAKQYINGGLEHEMIECYDYIDKPPKSGYRGIHLVYKYKNKNANYLGFNNLRIEIQIRSRFQHLWATAVETVGIFTRQALKSSQGSTDWLKYFTLTSAAFAMIENSSAVPIAPIGKKELVDEIRRFSDKLDVLTRLDAYRIAANQIRSPDRKGYFFLLRIDSEARSLRIEAFQRDQHAHATQRYLEVERAAKQAIGHDAVLVSVESVKTLRKAYPNYFADTREFVRAVQNFVSAQ